MDTQSSLRAARYRAARAVRATTGIVVALGALVALAPAAVAAVPSPENPQLLYEPITPGFDLSQLGHPSQIVVSGHEPDANPAALAARIHASGAKAYAYVQGLWLPKGREYFGIDIGAHLDWAFCAAGRGPTVGRVTAESAGEVPRTWYYIDANETAVRNAYAAWFRRLHDAGFDGIFADRGGVALRPGLTLPDGRQLFSAKSTCTQNPVAADATVADAYVRLLRSAKSVGLSVMLNYGQITGAYRLRPDALAVADQVVDEATDYPTSANSITSVLDAHRADAASGKLVSYVKDDSPNEAARREVIFFKWARAKLIPHPVAVMTGGNGCPGGNTASLPCWRLGLFPELNGAILGRAFSDGSLLRVACDPGSTTRCVFVRRYSRGMVLVNNSPTTKAPGTISLDLKTCRYLYDVAARRPTGSQCVGGFAPKLPSMSGRVYRYAEERWPSVGPIAKAPTR